MSGPLTGIRVLDFTQMMAGPLCSMVLGDLGATVIKVEPESGDAMREVGTARYSGFTEAFLCLNRNKRSLMLDLKKPNHVEIAKDLAKDADVVLENFRPGVADKLGLDYEGLSRENSSLVYCSISGFGSKSIYADKPALDPVIQALSGLMDLNGTKATGSLLVALPFSDYNTPMLASIGILGALNARNRIGKGQKIEVDMLKSTIFGMKPREQYTLMRGHYPTREGNENPQLCPSNTYQTRDGREICIIVHNAKYWDGLRRSLGIEVLFDDSRFGTMDKRIARRELVDSLIAHRIGEEMLAFWEDKFSRDDVIFGPVSTLEEALNLPEVRETMIH